jgi:hypothetical protein
VTLLLVLLGVTWGGLAAWTLLDNQRTSHRHCLPRRKRDQRDTQK